ncbi:FAD binding domain-containing protein [Aspergillus sp. HF37]|nr:FAD binding domain-containing protein [Aspergillus sp. HF37]
MTTPRFSAIVVGGSIAGLTLAHCLDNAAIDYLVLEKRSGIDDSALGGAVGIMPNGARILAQLGLDAAMSRFCEPMAAIHMVYPDGFESSDDWPVLVAERGVFSLGFPISILHRRDLLRVLHGALRDQSKILFNKRVVNINLTDSGVSVVTDDDSVYHGALAVGADGVHSVARSEAWRIARPPTTSSCISAEYSAVVGSSNGVRGLRAGDQVNRLHDYSTILLFAGKGGITSWVIVQKLDRKYTYPNIPRFSQDDAVHACQPLRGLRVYRNVMFGDVWDRRESLAMVALEEGLLPTWHHGRIVCIGDSVNKVIDSLKSQSFWLLLIPSICQMTPNFGQGANTAIEHAAVLANALHRLLESREEPSTQELGDALDSVHRRLFPHINTVNWTAWVVVRLQSYRGLLFSLAGRYVVPRLGGYMISFLAWLLAGSVVLEYLP